MNIFIIYYKIQTIYLSNYLNIYYVSGIHLDPLVCQDSLRSQIAKGIIEYKYLFANVSKDKYLHALKV